MILWKAVIYIPISPLVFTSWQLGHYKVGLYVNHWIISLVNRRALFVGNWKREKNDLVLSKDYGMQKISKGHLFIWWLLFNLAVTSILYHGYEKTLNILFIEGRSWNFFTPPPVIATTQTRLWADLVTEHSLIFVSE